MAQLMREALGESLRRARVEQSRTLRDVSTSAAVSLGYLSEVERGRKEASSELLAAICDALEVELSDVLREVSDTLAAEVAVATVSSRIADDTKIVIPAPKSPVLSAA